MKKIIILILLGSLTVVSCTKKNEINEISTPVMLKVQAVDKDGTAVESQITVIK
jgi:hypothetical protein